MLGADRDLTQFDRAAARVPWLRRLARRLRGVKPPRYSSLWEAFVNTIAFQQVSLHAASAIGRRLIVGFGPSLEHEGMPLYGFPSVGQVLGAEDDVLRAAGFRARKVATLRRAGEALALDTVAASRIVECPVPACAEVDSPATEPSSSI
jgi:DNA-3-methyladenine glycosylase II